MLGLVFCTLACTLLLSFLTPRSLVAQEVTRGPYLQKATPSSIVVRWRTDQATDSRVEYGYAPGLLSSQVTESGQTTEHEVEITGLAPSSVYYYSVGTTSQMLAGDDADHSFRTSPPPGSTPPLRFWILGDSGTTNAGAEAVRDAYYGFNQDHTQALLMLGDNAYNDGTDSEYQEAVFDFYPTLLRQTVLWSTLGNHDGNVNSDNQSGVYYDIFTFPRNGEAGGVASGTEAYYSFDIGNVHFVCLDSYDSDPEIGGPMMNWLENDLIANQRQWLIAFWHHPPYSKGSHDSDRESSLSDMRENAVVLLEDYGVDLVLSGHSHSYERSFLIDGHLGTSDTFEPSMLIDGGDGRENGDGAYQGDGEGAVYVVAGSSGKTSDAGSMDHPVMYLSLIELGSLVIDVEADQLDVMFLRETGDLDDYLTVTKQPLSPSSATVITSGDAFVRSSRPSTNYGDEDYLRVRSGSSSYQTYLSFDVPDLGGAAVESATLRLFVDDGSADGGTVFEVTDEWTESEITWDNAPDGVALGSLGEVDEGTWAEFDVTTAVSSDGSYSFALKSDSTNSAYYSSREGSAPPELLLDIATIPLPAPIAEFSADRLTGTVPLTVEFTDESDNSPDSWQWDFGDSNGSSVQNPTHTYVAPGLYSVNLTVTNAFGEDTLTRSDLIEVVASDSSTTLVPIADAKVRSGSGNNYGTKDDLRIRGGSTIWETYLKFDLSDIEGAVSNAILRLFVSDGSDDSGTLFVVEDNSWTETGIDYDNAPAFGLALGNAGPTEDGQWLEFDVSSYVTGVGTYSFGMATEDSNSTFFDSREGSFPPQLVVMTGDVVLAPHVSVTPTAHDFGSVGVGESASRDFTVTNTGSATLDVYSTVASGPEASAFVFDSRGGTFSLSPGASRTLEVAFVPESVGAHVASLDIASNGDEPLVQVSLSGIGASAPSSGVELEQIESGGDANSDSVQTASNLTAVDGHIYLAAMSYKADTSVTGVSGMGLAWTEVATQCGGRSATGVSLWVAEADADAFDDEVTADLSDRVANAVIAVARYSGVSSLGALATGNTNGVGNDCSGGNDDSSYSLDLTTTASNSLVYGVVAKRNRSHTPGFGYSELIEVVGGSGGNAASLAIEDQKFGSATGTTVDGSFNSDVDWAVVAVELRP